MTNYPPDHQNTQSHNAAPGCPDIDESEARFNPQEYLIALLLYNEGKCVKALPQASSGRNPDALVGVQKDQDGRIVDAVVTEFKSVKPGATSNRITQTVSHSIAGMGQARNIIIDASNSGLNQIEADRALRRVRGFQKGRLDVVRIIGDGFDIFMIYP